MGMVAIGLATPAMANKQPSTRLVSCQGESCVMVSGHRDNPEAAVLINGHAVAVEGRHGWHTRLSVASLRAWSPPFARRIDILVIDPGTRQAQPATADLPIGLLGHTTSLAALTVRLR